jgi:glutamate synthase domain-containing protein 2/glutamate synthase domain-containing protein 1/glutamate synthase domain-containing protein 3
MGPERRFFRAARPTSDEEVAVSIPTRRAAARSVPVFDPGPSRDRDACGIGLVADAEGRTSRALLDAALTGLACVRHRAAIAADGISGDGAGVLLPIPEKFFARVAAEAFGAGRSEGLGVVTAFLDEADDGARKLAEQAVADACAAEGIELLGWRPVPVDESVLGAAARRSCPAITQAILARPAGIDLGEGERRCFRARRRAQASCTEAGVRHYFASWSFSTVVYKALVMSDHLAGFYPDLAASDFEVSLAVFHSRFSTNTTPAWERAQPFRFLCHNGEINTLQGNEHRMAARGRLGTDTVGLGPEELFWPILSPGDSDSGKLDSAVELLVRGGRDVRHAMAMLVPEAWEGQRDLPSEVSDFFRYHACLTEPWDGPAGLIFTDGRRIGAALDRNGLRPLRYQICDDGLVVCASEVGAVPVAGHGKVRRGRLGPGQMLCVDPDNGGLQSDIALKAGLARRAPYSTWAYQGLRPFHIGLPVSDLPDEEDLTRTQAVFGVNKEEVAMVLKPMAADAKEPTFSMGDDVPFATVASRPRLVHHYLKQRFAQVTNPPIDHLRERLVMSLRTCLGPRQPLLTERPEAAHLLEMPSFLLYPDALERLLDPERAPFPPVRLDATFPTAEGPGGLGAAIRRLADEAEAAVAGGAAIVVISDAGIDAVRAPVPGLLATGAVHHRLITARLRSDASLIADVGDARDVDAVACLLGYGADAICPRLALESVALLADTDQLGEANSAEAQTRLQAALEDGVLKIASKMGISTVDGYRSAQIFEALGLAAEVVDTCLAGTASQVGGVGFDPLGEDVLRRHDEGYGSDRVVLDSPGFVRHRKGGEYHANDPDAIEVLHRTVGIPVEVKGKGRARTPGSPATSEASAAEAGADAPVANGDGGKVIYIQDHLDPAVLSSAPQLEPAPRPADFQAAHLLQRAIAEGRLELYEAFARLVNERPITELRDLLEFAGAADPVPLEEVEPAEAISRRFSSGAMSHGALSAEAHETLAVALNMVGGRSNCGEGGESRHRYRTRGGDVDRNSRIKQIASGRFGVTPEYCAFADELNIKMAQGSKPGEGGQLPGHKVSREIARLRHTQPGVGLISPPPHHDIYSIEDLAQLIYDLKQVNPMADVSVKLVAECGVGTIAAGVVKALADVVQISGSNGGTGASPLSSIKHAGMPWELGLADTQQALIENELRDRVRVRIDGGIKTGRDVVMAALLGADEYSFGTAVMLAEGCIMVRACHKDTCPTGIATQRPNLRAKFTGTPEGVAAYLMFVAEEARRILASLGLRSLDEAIGRVELLRQRQTGDSRADSLDLSTLLVPPSDLQAPRRFVAGVEMQRPRSELGRRLAEDAFFALWEGEELVLDYEISNSDRTVGAELGGSIGIEWGEGLPPGNVRARFTGSAGQSFGAFLADGVNLELTGEANDYVGKGMGGGRIVIRPPADDAGEPVLAGNTVLYGATGGQLFVAGRVGERFCVRNSGAVAVVEGTGDHACEYMTGGTVVVLGSVGYNLGAGMTGGEAYVYDPDGQLGTRLNGQLVEARRPNTAQAAELQFLVERHREHTGSVLAAALLADWDATLRYFWWVAPVDEVARIERAHEGMLGASA